MEKKVKYVFQKETTNTYMFLNLELGPYYLPKSIFPSKPAEIDVLIKA